MIQDLSRPLNQAAPLPFRAHPTSMFLITLFLFQACPAFLPLGSDPAWSPTLSASLWLTRPPAPPSGP